MSKAGTPIHAYVVAWHEPPPPKDSLKGAFSPLPIGTYGAVIDGLPDGAEMWGAGYANWPVPLIAIGVQRILRCLQPLGVRPIIHTHLEFWRHINPDRGHVRYPMKTGGKKRSGAPYSGWEAVADAAEALDRGDWSWQVPMSHLGELRSSRLAQEEARLAGERHREKHHPARDEYPNPVIVVESPD